jgi:hypothetical protein
MSTGFNTPEEEPYNHRNSSYSRSFIPSIPQPVGSVLPADKFPQNVKVPRVFQPLVIRDVEFRNRMWAVS